MENTTKNNKFTAETKRLIIIVSVILGVVLIAVCTALLLSGPATSDAATELDGVYSMSVSGIGDASYTFRADGTGVRSYSAGERSETEEFTYSIKDKTITFSWKDSGKTESHPFESGKMGKVDVIFSNEVTYYKQ
jgi:hypothetical protein